MGDGVAKPCDDARIPPQVALGSDDALGADSRSGLRERQGVRDDVEDIHSLARGRGGPLARCAAGYGLPEDVELPARCLDRATTPGIARLHESSCTQATGEDVDGKRA